MGEMEAEKKQKHQEEEEDGEGEEEGEEEKTGPQLQGFLLAVTEKSHWHGDASPEPQSHNEGKSTERRLPRWAHAVRRLLTKCVDLRDPGTQNPGPRTPEPGVGGGWVMVGNSPRPLGETQEEE